MSDVNEDIEHITVGVNLHNIICSCTQHAGAAQFYFVRNRHDPIISTMWKTDEIVAFDDKNDIKCKMQTIVEIAKIWRQHLSVFLCHLQARSYSSRTGKLLSNPFTKSLLNQWWLFLRCTVKSLTKMWRITSGHNAYISASVLHANVSVYGVLNTFLNGTMCSVITTSPTHLIQCI